MSERERGICGKVIAEKDGDVQVGEYEPQFPYDAAVWKSAAIEAVFSIRGGRTRQGIIGN